MCWTGDTGKQTVPYKAGIYLNWVQLHHTNWLNECKMSSIKPWSHVKSYGFYTYGYLVLPVLIHRIENSRSSPCSRHAMRNVKEAEWSFWLTLTSVSKDSSFRRASGWQSVADRVVRRPAFLWTSTLVRVVAKTWRWIGLNKNKN